jgi:hypothetical protein
MTVVGEKLWILSRGSAKIQPYDLGTQSETPPFPVGSAPYAIVAAGNGAWVSQRKPVVTWIRQPANYDALQPYAVPVAPTQNIPVPLRGAGAEAVGAGYLWVISDLPGRIDKSVALINLRTRKVASTINLGWQTTAIAYGKHSAWIGAYAPQTQTSLLLKVEPSSKRITPIQLETQDGAGPFDVAVGEGSVWVITARGNLLGIDPKTLEITHRIPMSAEQPTLLAFGAGFVWTANHKNYDVSKVDPQSNKIVRTIPLGSYSAIPCGIATIRGSILVMFGQTTCG